MGLNELQAPLGAVESSASSFSVAPNGAWNLNTSWFQGLTPLANNCRRFAANSSGDPQISHTPVENLVPLGGGEGESVFARTSHTRE